MTVDLARSHLTVSVVIPVKDDARPLAACLTALAQQTVLPFEVIVVDNASTDDSADVARSFGARVVSESTPGIGAASARGYDEARGALIARLDADSVPATNWIETVEQIFLVDPHMSAVTGRATFTDGPPLLRGPAAMLYLGAYFLLTGLALSHVPLFGSNMAMRRAAWATARSAVHSTDTMTHDDLDLSFHIGPTHRIRFSPRMLSGISMRPLYDGQGALRMRRGLRTVLLHWPYDLPWLRAGRHLVSVARRHKDSSRRR